MTSGSGVTVATAGTPPAGDGSSPILPLQCFFHLGRLDTAAYLVKRYHYSHRMPSGISLVMTWHLPGGLFGDAGEPVAACAFREPPTRWAEPVSELTRLVRVEEAPVPPLTGLIAHACRWMRRKGFDLLVSYADTTVGHHGGVYQAASWNYDGLRDRRMDGVIYGGRFVPGRMANNLWGTQSPSKLAEKGINVEPHYDDGKHLYWKALTDEGCAKALRLGLRILPYPKEGKA